MPRRLPGGLHSGHFLQFASGDSSINGMEHDRQIFAIGECVYCPTVTAPATTFVAR